MISLNFGREPGSSALDENAAIRLALEEAELTDASLPPEGEPPRLPLLHKRSSQSKTAPSAFAAISFPHAGQD